MSSKRSVIIAGIVGVAVIVAFVTLRGVNVPPSGTEGAIGAANRYQSEQISAKDVKLQDAAIQAFLQSDTFHKLATNPQFRNLVKEQSFREVAELKGYQAVLANKGEAASLAHKGFASYLVKPATAELVTSEAWANVSNACNLSEVLKSPAFYDLVGTVLGGKPTAEVFKTELEKFKGLPETFVAFASANPEVAMAIMNTALLEGKDELMKVDGAAELLASSVISDLLGHQEFLELVTLQSHEELMKNPELMSLAFGELGFSEIVAANKWSTLESAFSTVEP